MMRHVENSATMPDSTRAMRIPKSRPAKMIEMAEARRFSGARSAANGVRICGATDVMPTTNDSPSNTCADFVTASTSVKQISANTTPRSSGLRGRRSPRGETSTTPTA